MICDIKEKWKAIAGHVGTRDVRACADRFKAPFGSRMGDGTSSGSAMAGVSSTCVGATEGAGGTGRGGTEGKGYNCHSDY